MMIEQAPAGAQAAGALPEPAPAAPVREQRSLLVRAALESALIVLSVLLALFLDEWRAEREAAARAETARTYLVREIKANQARLQSETYLPYHLRMRALITDARGPAGPEREAALAQLEAGAFKGVHPFRAQDVAWTSFRTPDVTSRLPPEELFLLASVYNVQDGLEELSTVYLGGMIAAAPAPAGSQDRQLETIRSYFSDAIPAEQELLGLYEAALRELEGDARR